MVTRAPADFDVFLSVRALLDSFSLLVCWFGIGFFVFSVRAQKGRDENRSIS